MRDPHRTIISRSDLEKKQLNQLASALKDQMLKEIDCEKTQKCMKLSYEPNCPGETGAQALECIILTALELCYSCYDCYF